MPIPVTYNGASYSIPVYNDTGYAQGPGNLSNYLVALASGSLQQTGGSFPLTADANFGNSFGLAALYYKSVSANIASAGVVRLANGDAIEWRNVANSGNDVLAVNGSDQLTYNGAIIPSGSSSFVSSITGTANEIIASSSTGAVTLSTPQAIATTSTPTFGSLTLTNPLTVANGGTGTTTPGLVAGTNITITGSWPDQTINSTSGGSGTVDVGILNRLTWYPASTAEVAASNFVINNSTGALAIPGALTVGGQIISEVGSVSAPGITFSGALSDGFYEPTSGHLAITLGGVQAADFINANYLLMSMPINMSGTGGPYKIIGLANGVNPQDAAAFGQIRVPVICQYSGSPTGTIGSTDNLVTYGTKVIDTASAYSSGVFTAPTAGYYLVTASIQIAESVASGTAAQLSIYHNGSAVFIGLNRMEATVTGQNFQVQVSGVINCAASDTISMYFQTTGTSTSYVGSNYSWLNIMSVG